MQKTKREDYWEISKKNRKIKLENNPFDTARNFLVSVSNFSVEEPDDHLKRSIFI